METISQSIDIGTLIDHNPTVKGGRAKIAGTGVTVMRIVGWHKMGWSTEEIVDNYEGNLDLAQIHAALAYYYVNQQEIENQLAEEQETYAILAHRSETKRTD
ncbi:MAG: DUF433 domain-containing protein [Caldilineaceae bacterium]|nr:DUF433 domain-containing protein [Caldilineaceae bacterium]